jgi:sarcosine oxidase subunit gamma
MPEHITGRRAVVLGGRAFPSQTGETVPGRTRVLCLGPGEWLIVSDVLSASAEREHIQEETQQQGLALVDVTDGLAVLRIQGPAAREVLAKGCGLDLHARAFRAGQCARTRFAQIPVIVDCLGEPPRFELYVARSYLSYLQSWLIDAAGEFEEPMSEICEQCLGNSG